jgi:hypothetical protein
VNATTPLREEAPARLEPLVAVLARDLQIPAGGGMEAELQRRSPAERARALLGEGRREAPGEE